MTSQDALPGDFALGRLVMKFHDQEGVPFETTLQILSDQNRKPALLGLMVEVASRRLPRKLLAEAAECWATHFQPTPGEVRAITALREEWPKSGQARRSP